MLDTLTAAVHALNALTPLGLAAGLAYIIYHMTAKRGNVRLISENHLSGLPEDSARLRAIEEELVEIRGLLQGLARQESLLQQALAVLNQISGRLG